MAKLVVGGFLLAAMAGACTTDSDAPTGVDMQAVRNNGFLPNGIPFVNPTGFAATVSTQGRINLTNEFFQDLGTNGRRCVTCHLPSAGWGTTPSQIQAVFEATQGGVIDDGVGLGAIFRTNDGSVSPNAPTGTLEERRQAYSMLLSKGLIRVGIGIPAGAEFDLAAADDPYGYASAAELSLFRRPLPSTNLKFLSAVMWDGRETFAGQSIHFDLSDQSNGATQGHAAGAPLTDAQRESIVGFETSLHTAQVWDEDAKYTNAAGAQGGPNALVSQNFYIGINDLFGDSATGAAFDPNVFTIYNGWKGSTNADRAAVARGQAIFNTKRIDISGVSGINDEAIFGNPTVVHGTCTTCHDSPNAGDHSTVAPLNIGLVDAARRTPDMPLYTLRCNAQGQADGVCTAGDTKVVTDPGRALISGKWKHIGRFKGPVLRGLAARAPYFHNGSAATLGDAVDFYDERFHIGLTSQEKSDLVAFLQTL